MASIWIAAASFLVLVVGLGVYVVRSRSHGSGRPHTVPRGTATGGHRMEKGSLDEKARTPIWGVKISTRDMGKACPEARKILDQSFPIGKAPSLPLPKCPYPRECMCFFLRLEERRKGERRSGNERRKDVRFEPGQQRRAGHDRRRKTPEWDEL